MKIPSWFVRFVPRLSGPGWLGALTVSISIASTAFAPLPVISANRAATRSTVEEKAVEVASSLAAVDLADGELCPRSKLHVSWTEPSGEFERGSYLTPIGPAPSDTTRSVNGIVVCQGGSYSYMGFEAFRSNGKWVVHAVPELEAEGDEEEAPPNDPPIELPPVPVEPPAPAPAPSPTKKVAPKAAPKTFAGLPTVSTDGIDGYAQYDPQQICDPSAKPGVADLRNIVLARHSATRSAGITRNCSIGGRSEHKEGRAWDWWVNVNKPSERAAAEDIIGWLLATDSAGHRHAMARRMGVMYIIWDRKIWSAYRANDGWRAYNGPKPHTDHVHFSFSWAGARRQTSYWTGVPISTGFAPPPVGGDKSEHKGWERRIRIRPAPTPTTSASPRPRRRTHPVVTTSPSPSTSPTPRRRRPWPTASPSPLPTASPTPVASPSPSAAPSPSPAGQSAVIQRTVTSQLAPSPSPSVKPSPTPRPSPMIRQTTRTRTTRQVQTRRTRTVRSRTRRTYPRPSTTPTPRPSPLPSPRPTPSPSSTG